MTWIKLTYSSSKCNNYVYFCLYADYFDVDRVTDELGVEPTSVTIKGDPRPKDTSWDFQIDAGEDIDLVSRLNALLDVFEGKVDEINRLKRELGLESKLQFVMDIDINPASSTPYFGFDLRAIDFLSNTRTWVDFDIYKADTIGLLDRMNDV